MKTHTRIVATAGFLVLALVSVSSADYVKLTARVPFDFVVGDETLPRDVYRVSRAEVVSSALVLRSARRAFVIIAQPAYSGSEVDKPQLVFHRIADKYFLREVRFLGSTGMDLPETRAEREAAERVASGAPIGVERVVIVP